MLIQTEKISLRDERHLKSYTGVDLSRYEVLRSELAQLLEENRRKHYEAQVASGKRRRGPGGGRKSALPSVDDKLLYVLHYHKSYPTMDNIGSEFQMCRSAACDHVHSLSRLLKVCLERLQAVPKRKLEAPEELMAYLKGLGDIDQLLIDVTERPHRRPKDKDQRSALYSGKKSGSRSRTPSLPR